MNREQIVQKMEALVAKVEGEGRNYLHPHESRESKRLQAQLASAVERRPFDLSQEELDFALATPQSRLTSSAVHDLYELENFEYGREDLSDRVSDLKRQILGRERELFAAGFAHVLQTINTLSADDELCRIERAEDGLAGALSALNHQHMGLFV